MTQYATPIPTPALHAELDPDFLLAADDEEGAKTPAAILFLIAAFAVTVIVFGNDKVLYRVPYYLGVLSAVAAVLVYFQYAFPIPVPVLLFTSWFAWSGITAFATESREISMTALGTVGQILIMFIVFATTCQDSRAMWVVGVAFVIGAIANAIAAVVFGYNVRDGRAAGFAFNPNAAANVYGVAICILLAAIPATRSGFLRLCCLAVIGWLLFAIVRSGSRGGALTIILTLASFLFFYRRAVLSKPALLGFIVTIIAASAIILPKQLADTELGKRTVSAISTLKGDSAKTEGSTASRMNLKFKALRVAIEHPILGVGIGCFTPYMFRLEGETLSTHDNFVDVLSGTGFPGFALYYSIYVWLWVTASRLRRSGVLTPNEMALVALSQTYIIFRSAWDVFENTGWNTKPPWIIMAVLAGVLTGMKVRVARRIDTLHSYGVI